MLNRMTEVPQEWKLRQGKDECEFRDGIREDTGRKFHQLGEDESSSLECKAARWNTLKALVDQIEMSKKIWVVDEDNGAHLRDWLLNVNLGGYVVDNSMWSKRVVARRQLLKKPSGR
jgi:hypothetical protein